MVKTIFTINKRSSKQTKIESSIVGTTTESALMIWPVTRNKKIKVTDGLFSAIAKKGIIKISPVSKLSQSSNYRIIFDSSMSKLKDMVLGRMIGRAKELGGIYFLDDDYQSQSTIALCWTFFLVLIRLWFDILDLDTLIFTI